MHIFYDAFLLRPSILPHKICFTNANHIFLWTLLFAIVQYRFPQDIVSYIPNHLRLSTPGRPFSSVTMIIPLMHLFFRSTANTKSQSQPSGQHHSQRGRTTSLPSKLRYESRWHKPTLHARCNVTIITVATFVSPLHFPRSAVTTHHHPLHHPQ